MLLLYEVGGAVPIVPPAATLTESEKATSAKLYPVSAAETKPIPEVIRSDV